MDSRKVRRPQWNDYGYLEPGFGRACYLDDLQVWRKYRTEKELVAPVAEEAGWIRPDVVLDSIPASEWTEEEAISHLEGTFEHAFELHHDLLEPYVILLGDAGPDDEPAIMRRGLRETIKERMK